MPATPDRRPGTLVENTEILLDTDSGAMPSTDGAFTYDPGTGEFKFYDGLGIFNPRSSGTGISVEDHKVLLQLIHFIDEGPAEGFATGATKTVTGGAFPTSILWKRADATKLVEQLVTWTGTLPTTVQWKMYASDGTTVLATVTDTISYSGPFETGRTRSIV